MRGSQPCLTANVLISAFVASRLGSHSALQQPAPQKKKKRVTAMCKFQQRRNTFRLVNFHSKNHTHFSLEGDTKVTHCEFRKRHKKINTHARFLSPSRPVNIVSHDETLYVSHNNSISAEHHKHLFSQREESRSLQPITEFSF